MARKTPDPTKRIYKGPGAQIGAMAWSDDERFIAAADWKGVVTLWSVDDTKPRWATKVGPSHGVAIGFDGDRVIATEATGSVTALALDDGHPMRCAADLPTCNGHNALYVGAGRVVFYGSSRSTRRAVTAVDAERFEVVWQRVGDEVFAGVEEGVVYLADRVAVNPERWVLRGIDLVTGAERSARPSGGAWACRAHAATNVVAVSDFRTIQFRRLDAPDAEAPAVSISTSGGAGSCAFSPDGRWLAALHYDRVAFIAVATGALTLSTTKHTATVSALAWSRDGRTLLSAGWDRAVRVHAAPAAV